MHRWRQMSKFMAPFQTTVDNVMETRAEQYKVCVCVEVGGELEQQGGVEKVVNIIIYLGYVISNVPWRNGPFPPDTITKSQYNLFVLKWRHTFSNLKHEKS